MKAGSADNKKGVPVGGRSLQREEIQMETVKAKGEDRFSPAVGLLCVCPAAFYTVIAGFFDFYERKAGLVLGRRD